jgi:hypothetical protein
MAAARASLNPSHGRMTDEPDGALGRLQLGIDPTFFKPISLRRPKYL